MAFPPNQNSSQGNVKSLSRAAWEDLTSGFVAVTGGRGYATAGYGYDKYRHDDPEGWFPRFNFHGTNDQIPFNSVTNGSIDNVSKTGLPNIRRKNYNSTGVSYSTSAYVLKIVNNLTSGEVYTNSYGSINNPKPATHLICATPSDGTWHMTWYARKSSSTGNSGTVRMTAWLFGSKLVSGGYAYNFSGHNLVQVGTTTTSSPATGGTSYYRGPITLSTTWTKYSMTVKFNGNSNIDGIFGRFDNDDGSSSGTTIYIDRPTLHPMNINVNNGMDGTSPPSINGATFMTY